VAEERWKVRCMECGEEFTEIYPEGLDESEESWSDPEDPKPCSHMAQYELLERVA